MSSARQRRGKARAEYAEGGTAPAAAAAPVAHVDAIRPRGPNEARPRAGLAATLARAERTLARVRWELA